MDKFSFLGNADPVSIERLYQQFLENPQSVDESWMKFFQGFDFAKASYSALPAKGDAGDIPENFAKEFKVINLINGYRSRGHLFTRTNPVRERRKYLPTLDVENFGLAQADMDTVFQAGSLIGIGPAKLSAIVQHLKDTYCDSIGVEYMYIRNQEVVEWLQGALEKSRGRRNFSDEEKKRILKKLNEAVGFESFLDKKFVGQKRFSLEGVEALIPALDYVIEAGAERGIEEFVMGMAHRGRLSVLGNIFKKNYSEIFSEFEGKAYADDEFSGDVKYHLGYTSKVKTRKGKDVRITLAPNPSHLEAVDPVVEGITRAFADKKHNTDFSKIAPILIHGDAAIAGQGVVYEVIQMAKLDGYKTGGTIHMVTNNQVGFTTNYTDGRSSIYCTDVGKVTLSPVFHVNADDVEAVVYAIELAMEFRQRFNGDVFIDLLGYRKYGHNEGDEPRFTQPILYKAIAKHPNPSQIYVKKLMEQGVVDQAFVKDMEERLKSTLESELEKAKEKEINEIKPFLEKEWENIRVATVNDFDDSVKTGVKAASLKKIAKTLYTIPEGKNFFKKIQKLLQDRQNMVEKTDQLDWGMAEQLAYGSLLIEGYNIRISGQDVERGTFSHRHAVIKIEDSEEEYVPLRNLDKNQGKFEIYNSPLSEYAVLGFDYGYSLARPDALVIWEAQFGDFNNGAQIIIDQFISAAEDKWRSMSGLVMYLPHGYEGQGAEHSSGRMERFLTLCAELNMYVANCTTPANLFHLIRRQLKDDIRKPLVLFTPKSLLRHPRCTSSLAELADGQFREIIDDGQAQAAKVRKVVFCCGKFYYDLEEEKNKAGADDIALVRIEQLYPFPKKQFDAVLKKYNKAKSIVWAQEEPENMGAWGYLLRTLRHVPFEFVGRSASGSPATGSSKRHAIEQKALINQIFQSQLEGIQS
ncbi:MAG: 2-oxoglutarate dehydrogenase E1 component [Flavobacteriales bacterium]